MWLHHDTCFPPIKTLFRDADLHPPLYSASHGVCLYWHIHSPMHPLNSSIAAKVHVVSANPDTLHRTGHVL